MAAKAAMAQGAPNYFTVRRGVPGIFVDSSLGSSIARRHAIAAASSRCPIAQAEAMGFILAALFFNTLTAPVVKMTQNSEGGYDYNKWSDSASLETPSQYRRDSCPSDEVVWRDNAPRRCIYFFAELMKLGVALAWCFKAYQENDREVVNTVEIKILRRVRAESSRRPPRHRRDACSMAWRCRFLAARRSQDGRVIAEK